MLEFSHVHVSSRRTPILEDVSVRFRKGTVTSIIGPNGCGKTTLLQCLNGVSRVTGGSVLLEGKNFLALPARERARLVSFLPQVRTVIPALPVKTLVEHGRFPHLGFARRKSTEDIQIVRQAMEFACVDAYENQPVDTLSGGIRQRVFFAMLLAQDCDYLVLDEPTTYLDLNGQRDFLNMFSALRDQGKTVILVLHDISQALRISDRVVIMNQRKIAAEGTPEECLRQHIIEEVFGITSKTFSDGDGTYYFFG